MNALMIAKKITKQKYMKTAPRAQNTKIATLVSNRSPTKLMTFATPIMYPNRRADDKKGC